MKFACLIITYTSVKQTARLINKLNNGQFDFYIHVDKKLDLETHRDLFDVPNVYFIKDRVDIKWGGFSTLKASLNGVRQIIASGIKYDFVNLLSGQDYPVKSAAYIADFLERNKGSEFIFSQDFDTEWQEAKARVEKFHLTDLNFKGKTRIEGFMNFFIGKRKFPLNLRLHGRETFWTLSLDCVAYVIHFIDSNPKLGKFLKYTWGSDEFAFHTIILNSSFRDRVVNMNYRYMDWPPGEARPKVLLTEDFEKIVSTDNIFARKFDINTDENILDLIDAENQSQKT